SLTQPLFLALPHVVASASLARSLWSSRATGKATCLARGPSFKPPPPRSHPGTPRVWCGQSMFRFFGIGTCSRSYDLAHVLVGESVPTSPEHALQRSEGGGRERSGQV